MKKIYLLLLSVITLGMSHANAQCTANFQYTTNSLTVNFIDSFYSPNITSILRNWNFGDGNLSSNSNPSHTYTNAGTYTACLTIYDSSLACLDTVCKVITVTGNTNPAPCMASFTYSATANNLVNFFSNVTGGSAPYTYDWDFGSGSSSHSTAANPTYTYSTPGSYITTLTVTDVNGTSCSYADSVTINSCSAFFTYSANSNGIVNFTNQSNPLNAALLNINWNFGDGNSSNLIHPTHTYTTSGTYLVTLNYFDSLTNCFASYSDTISISIGMQSSCNASFTIAKDSTVPFGAILYNLSSNFSSHSYSWNFGDGTTGSGRTPVHQYQSFGSYLVCLTITDSILNCSSTFCDTLGMDSLGNLKAGFGLRVVNPIAVGINEIDNISSINVYPNPATNLISIDLTGIENRLNVQILDITGKVVLKKQNLPIGNIEAFDISNLTGGLYFMVLNDGESQKIEKFIKQ